MRLNILLSEVDPFNFKTWKEFLNQYTFLAEHGITLRDVEEAVLLKEKEDKQEYLLAHTGYSVGEKCPDCSSPMQLLPVNDSPSTQTGDDSKSLWLCRNCFYEKFSTKTVKEEMLCLQD